MKRKKGSETEEQNRREGKWDREGTSMEKIKEI
jgi:hypothetical protein